MLLKVESDGDHFLSFLYLSNSTEPQILSTIRSMKTKQGQERLSEKHQCPCSLPKHYTQEGAETELTCEPQFLEGLAVAFWGDVCLLVCF